MLFQKNGEGAVFHDSREILTVVETRAFLTSILKKRFRKKGYVDSFLKDLDVYGSSEMTWSFVPRIIGKEDHWVTVHAWKTTGGVALTCIGPQAEAALEHSNRKEERRRSRDERRTFNRRTLRERRHRSAKKRKLRLERQRSHASITRQPKPARRKYFVAAPLSLALSEVLTPQFRKNRVTWCEALTAVSEIFEVRRNAKFTARQRVAREMWDSLERSGFRFAQYKRRGFCIRVDLIDGVWRGEITPLRISCTKDTSHATYRRMRAYLASILTGLPSTEQQQRRKIMFSAAILKAA